MHQVSRLLTQLDHIIKSLKHKHGKRKKEVRRTKLYTTRMRWKLGKFNTLGLFFTFCCSNIIKNYRKGHYTNTKPRCTLPISHRYAVCFHYIAEKYSLLSLGSGFMDFSPGFHPAGQTSSGLSCTNCKACRIQPQQKRNRKKKSNYDE